MMAVAILTPTFYCSNSIHKSREELYDMQKKGEAEKKEEGDKQEGEQAAEKREEANGTAAQVSRKRKGKSSGNGQRDSHAPCRSL